MQFNQKQIIDWTKQNKWIIVVSIFFIIWKFFLIGTLWNNRHIPPSPDDSYVYIQHIDSVLQCKSFIFCKDNPVNFDTYTGFDHLTYRLFFGTIGKLLELNAIETYHLGFYIGTILLLGSLLFFLKRLCNNNKNFIAFSLFILALYNGSGAYHGFFWVVPSFFSLAFFFFILGILFDHTLKQWLIILGVISPFYIFNHVLSLYFLCILFLFFVLFSLLTKNIDRQLLKKIIFFCTISIIVYAPVAIYYSHTSYGNPYSPEFITKSIVENKSTTETTNTSETILNKKNTTESSNFLSSTQEKKNIMFLGWKKIEENYFKLIFLNWLGYPLLFFCLVILFYFKQFKLLSLYIAGILFVAISSLNINGERALIYLWPVTFLLYGQAAWFWLKVISKNIPLRIYSIALKGLTLVVLLVSITLSSVYAYLWNAYLNQAQNIAISDELLEYLTYNTSPEEKIVYSPEATFINTQLFLNYQTKAPERGGDLSRAKFYVSATKNCDSYSYRNLFEKFFRILSKFSIFSKEQPFSEVNCTNISLPNLANFSKDRQFGEIVVYQEKKK
jgi:hypothetical protein